MRAARVRIYNDAPRLAVTISISYATMTTTVLGQDF
jgi:hypothetical protein